MHSGMQNFVVEDNYGIVGGKGAVDGWETGPQTTEWEDALVKHKIISKRTRIKTTDKLNTEWRAEQEKLKQTEMDRKTLDELDELEDELEDDVLRNYRKQRLLEMQEKKAKNKFGTVEEINKPQFVPEVSEGSKNGHWVVCCLFEPGARSSNIMLHCLQNIAARHPDVKFVKIVGSICIENYPSRNCPTLLLYHNGEAKGHIKGTTQFGGETMTADVIEWELAHQVGAWETDQEMDPWKKFAKLHFAGKKHEWEDEEDDSLDI